jgi:hypothetical protein
MFVMWVEGTDLCVEKCLIKVAVNAIGGLHVEHWGKVVV